MQAQFVAVAARTVADPDVLSRAVFSELARIAEGLGIDVERSTRPGDDYGAEAFFVGARGDVAARIVVDVALRPLPAAHALAHELAHAVLHRDAAGPRAAQEIEAEIVAFALLRFMGLDTLSSSLEYISRWASCDEDLHLTQPRVTQACETILARRCPRSF